VQILEKGFKKGKASLVAINLFGLFDSSEFDERLTAGFRGGHARAEIVFDVELEVAFQFGGKFVVAAIPAE
jgi:hypothetical protein